MTIPGNLRQGLLLSDIVGLVIFLALAPLFIRPRVPEIHRVRIGLFEAVGYHPVLYDTLHVGWRGSSEAKGENPEDRKVEIREVSFQ